MALPVVCTETLADNVLDETTGLVAPLRDAEGLATRLERLARDAKLRRRLGSAGRERAVEAFALEDQIAKFSDWYRELLARTSSSPSSVRCGSGCAGSASAHATRARTGSPGPRRRPPRGQLAVESLIEEFVPDGDPILIVSRGDAALLELRPEAWHFPQADGGDWLGHHPASSVEAIAQLEELAASRRALPCVPTHRALVARALPGLARPPRGQLRLREADEGIGAIFDLGPWWPFGRSRPFPAAQRDVA